MEATAATIAIMVITAIMDTITMAIMGTTTTAITPMGTTTTTTATMVITTITAIITMDTTTITGTILVIEMPMPTLMSRLIAELDADTDADSDTEIHRGVWYEGKYCAYGHGSCWTWDDDDEKYVFVCGGRRVLSDPGVRTADRGCQVEVYEQPKFAGNEMTTTRDHPTLTACWDKRISSIRVLAGKWQFRPAKRPNP
jgi:hypothetical protein